VKVAASGCGELGCKRLQHPDVIAGLKLCFGDQPTAADLVQCVLKFGLLVGGIDVDKNEPCIGAAELGE